MTRIVKTDSRFQDSELRPERPSELQEQHGLLQNQLVAEYKNRSSSNTFGLGQPYRNGQAGTAATRHLQGDTPSAADYDQGGKQLAPMTEHDTQIKHTSAVASLNQLFYQDIKSQQDIARKTQSSFEVKSRKKSKRNVKPTANFDIKVRSFVYSGVPSESHNSLHHKGVIKRKQFRDKLEKQDRDKGCTKFMYRNVKALQFEKDQLQRGGDVDALGREAVAWNSALGDASRPRSLGLDSYMSASDGLLRTGVMKNFYED